LKTESLLCKQLRDGSLGRKYWIANNTLGMPATVEVGPKRNSKKEWVRCACLFWVSSKEVLGRAESLRRVCSPVDKASTRVVTAGPESVSLLSPFLVEYAGNLLRALLLAVRVLPPSASLASEYRQYRKDAYGVAVLMPLGYLLVLFAMQWAPVSRVAPMREMSMMVGAYFGVQFLRERQAQCCLWGSVLIAGGVALMVMK
jgi:hypothetical protein